MELQTFAAEHRLKGFRMDECGDPEVVGKYGHLFECDSIFGVCLEGAGTKTLERRKRDGLEAGMTFALDCDLGEAILHFDPADGLQARTAVKMAGIRRKKRVSREQIETLRRFGFQRRLPEAAIAQ